ncbi:MAG: TIGR03936 family radical SAM-associated protein [Omnitrophica WOR_2 bacterium]
MRLRITYSKTDAMRYTGNLDLHRAWERTFRRANLPLAYSQGFHPQPRINLASALPLGFTSDGEVADIWLEKDPPLQEIRAALEQALPPGILIHSIEEVDNQAPSLQTQVQSAEYIVILLENPSGLEQRIADLLRLKNIPRQRRDKAYDLRPLILDVQRMPDDARGYSRLKMRLLSQDGATGRPEEVLAAMDIQPETARVHRTRLFFA